MLKRSMANWKNLAQGKLSLFLSVPSRRDLHRPEFICRAPFNNLELLPTGAVACCGDFFTKAFCAAHTDTGSYRDMWNNRWYRTLRRSVTDGTYRYCTDRCPVYLRIRSGKPKWLRREKTQPHIARCIEDGRFELPEGPRTVLLSNDPSCNLCCRSCRLAPVNLPTKEHDRLFDETVSFLQTVGADLETLGFSTRGEPFFSRYYLRLMREYLGPDVLPKTSLDICTNGTLLTPAMWDSLRCRTMIRRILVSVDAATEATYEKIRGPYWKRLQENLRFLRTLRESGALPEFQVRMVVQSLNWREMEPFVDMAADLLAQPVFQIVYRWAGIEDRDVVYSPAHPDHAAFLAHLRAFDARHPKVEAYYRQLL